MSQEQWAAVDRYITDTLLSPDPVLVAEQRVSATAIQTVGSKGYDGFTLAVVMEEISK